MSAKIQIERRARRLLAREGYRLSKSGPDCYSIVNERLNGVLYHYHEIPLDQVCEFLSS